jgi:CIC family chloride channel protein
MGATAPPRPPDATAPVDRAELEALVEALIEEARRRARRRRRRYGAAVVAVALAAGVRRALIGETIYTIKLRRRGIDVLTPPRPDPLAQIKVSDVMRREVITLANDLPFPAVVDQIRTHPYTSFPVVDHDGRLRGILGYNELRDLLTGDRPDEKALARDLMRTPPPVCYPDDTLTEVTEKFRLTDLGRLPVVSREDPDIILGVISHTDVLAAYERFVLGQTVTNGAPGSASG